MLKREIGVPETKAWNHKPTYLLMTIKITTARTAAKIKKREKSPDTSRINGYISSPPESVKETQ
jgi:hypothetical protein